MVDGNQLTKLSGDWVIIGSEANESTESGQRDVDILYRDKVGYRVHVTYAINTLNADCVAFGSVTNA